MKELLITGDHLFEAPPESTFQIPGFKKSFGFDMGGYTPWQKCEAKKLESELLKFLTYGRRAGVLFSPNTEPWDLTDDDRTFGVYVSEFGRHDEKLKKGFLAMPKPINLETVTVEQLFSSSLNSRMIFENQSIMHAEVKASDYLKTRPSIVAINLIGRSGDFTWDMYSLEQK